MDTSFRLFPESASTTASDVDLLYFCLVGITAFFTLLISILILYFAVRYRRQARVDRSRPSTGNVPLEIAWSVVPLALMMFSFVWGAKIYFDEHRPPQGALEIDVVGKQWMWKLQHAQGKREINELHVPVGTPVRLQLISQDVIHSFYVPAFRIKQDVLPGRYVTTWFEPTQTGVYHLFCAEYCGTSHSSMIGRVIVQDETEFAEWLGRTQTEPPATTGARLFERFRCDSCHGDRPEARGPSLQGVFGRQVPLDDGSTVIADANYLRRSMLEPAAQVVAGYRPVMPTFRGQLEEDQILQLIAYLKSLDGSEPAEPADGPPTDGLDR